MFKYFNPVWIIKNFLQPSLGPEILVPAAIGAVSSAAMGKSPITGALLGGATGGILGGAGGAGGNLFSGFKSALPSAAPSLGSGGYAALGQAGGAGIGGASTGLTINPILNSVDDVMPIDKITSSYIDDMASQGFSGTNLPANNQIAFKDFYPTANFTDDGLSFGKSLSSADQMFANKFVTEQNPFALDPRRIAVDTPLTFGERLSDIGSNTMSYAKQNPMTVLSGGQSLLDIRQQNEQADKQRLNEAVAMGNQQIRKGQSGPMAGNLLQVKRIG
jgi:hypothetical protein